MLPAHRDIVVTGLGAVCALGSDCGALWSAIEAGRCGIESIGRFPTADFSLHTGALVPGRAEPAAHDAQLTRELGRCFAESAAREAVHQAHLDESPVARHRIGVVFGTGLGDLAHPSHRYAENLADALRCDGPRITVSTACSSSTGALAVARDLLASDAADVVLAGGADVLTPEVFAGFHALGVLSPTRCAPFSYPFGTSLGEGAGFMVLERLPAARARGAEILAALPGCGLSADAYHETSPEPKGSGVARALRWALCDAGLSPDDIGYVNAHGSGTEANDRAEWLGIRQALPGRAERIPVSSTKGALGHAQGAAGVLEAIVTLLAMRRDVVPPTLNFAGPRPDGPTDPVPGPHPRPAKYTASLCVNAAFGGANAAVAFSLRTDAAPARTRRPVAILGVGLVGAHGLGTDEFATDPTARARPGIRVPEFAIERLVPSADPRGLDPTSRFLTASAALALADAGVRLRGAARDGTGLLAGMRRPSPASLDAFTQSVAERGLHGLSASAFARIVLNAPAGFCSKLLSLRGPLTVIATGAGSGLAAIVQAAEVLSTLDGVTYMLAGAAEELAAGAAAERAPVAEGAACLLLGPAEAAGSAAMAGGVQLSGWGLAGPGRLADAVARGTAGDPDAAAHASVFRAEDWAWPAAAEDDALSSALACAAAVLAVRRGEAPAALVTSERGRGVTSAALLTR